MFSKKSPNNQTCNAPHGYSRRRHSSQERSDDGAAPPSMGYYRTRRNLIPYLNDAAQLRRWERRISSQTQHRFEYEIFTHGGIDLNRAIGVGQVHYNQREIAFAGGIIPVMIRSARGYIGIQIVRIWINTNFDNMLNPPGENPPLAELPDVHRTPSDAEAYIMISGSDGDGVADPLFDTTPVPLSSVASVCDTIARGPKGIIGHPCGTQVFRGGVDAVLPNPKNAKEMYIFSGGNYALIDIAPEHQEWSSLRDAGFATIDAVLPNPAVTKRISSAGVNTP
ncbi:hypothetical protein GGX14DRAFT_401938 [Mycena pura]|uniref:Pierisin-like domain-containing protein n=1 Tax=Mycena pura TaxID=153505 RepID=A0AAD6UZ09_9AGAR|nr:hypothetical protein GGX14DRAFT_401938 [Mycena pura]